MAQPVDTLVRNVAINGVAAMEARLIIREDDGNAYLVAKPNGTGAVISWMLAPTVENVGGTYHVTDGLNTWEATVDTRCGSCGGRYELSTLDPAPLIAAV